MSAWMIWVFIVEFVIMSIWALFEKNWYLVLYSFGAILLNLGVIGMMKYNLTSLNV